MKFQKRINKAALATLKQGFKSINDLGICAYTNGGGGRCAVGHMMTDEELEKFGSYEDTGVSGIVHEGWGGATSPHEVQVLEMFQTAHDTAREDNFEQTFMDNLRYSDVKELNKAAKYIDKKTFQDQINAAALATYNQGTRSMHNSTACAYQSKEGNKCAVGHMMTDFELNEFRSKMEDVMCMLDWRPNLTNKQRSTLTQLQGAHDNAEGDFKAEFLEGLETSHKPELVKAAEHIKENTHDC